MRRFRSAGRGVRAAAWTVAIGSVLAGRAYGIDQPVTWDGGGSGNDWSTADNWNPAVSPKNINPVEFLVTIPGPSFTVNHDAVMGDNVITEFTLGADSRLNILEGTSLTVLKTARIGGILDAQGGDFFAEFVPEEGSEDEPVMFTGNRARVFASGGAEVRIGGGIYDSTGFWSDRTTSCCSNTVETNTFTLMSASGVDTLLDLSSVTEINAGFNSGGNDNDIQRITASGGATIDLSGVTVIIAPADGNDRIEFSIADADSSIALTGVQELSSAGSGNTRFNLSGDTSLDLPALSAVDQGDFILGMGATITAPMLSDIDDTTFSLAQGARLNGAGTFGIYDSTGFWSDRTTSCCSNTVETNTFTLMSASGVDTLLDLSSITEINAGFNSGGNDNDIQRITASGGAMIDLSGVTLVTAPADLSSPGNSDDRIEFIVADADSSILLGALELVTSASRGHTRFNLTNGASMSLPALESLHQVRFDLNQGSQLHANGSMPIVYSSTGFWSDRTTSCCSNTVETNTFTLMSASGVDTLLDLSSVTAINAGFDSSGNDNDIQRITASGGAWIDLSGVTTVTAPNDGNDRIEFNASSGGFIDLPSLTNIAPGGSGTVRFTLTDGGSLTLGDVSFNRPTTITLTGGSTLHAAAFRATGSSTASLSLTGADNLVDITGNVALGTRLSINAALGSNIHIGGDFSHQHKIGSGAMLEPAVVHFDGDHGDKQFVEVGSLDFGLAGPVLLVDNHFGMGQMVIGTADQPANVQLVDFFANLQAEHTDPLEAIYLGNIKAPAEEQLEGLIIHAGSMLFTGTRSIYTNTPDDADGLELVSIAEEFEAAGSNRIAWGDGTIVLSADMDDNGVFDAFDVDDFELALANPDAYLDAHPDVDLAFLNLLGDLDGDSVMDAFDVDEFEALLAGARPAAPSALQSIPEPTTALLLGMAGLIAGGSRPRRKQARTS